MLSIPILAVLATACGGGGEDSATQQAAAPVSQQPEPAAGPPATAASDPALDDSHMATAVVTGKAAAAVDLKYDIAERPEPGQPVEVELSFAPRLAADELRASISGVEGLTVVSGAAETFESVEAGERYRSKLLLQADGPGLYYVTVAAEMVTAVQTEARVFSIPVAFGAVPAQAKAAPAVDAEGQAIQPMRAEETSDSNDQ